jgi:hypothetical protein
MKRFLTIVPIVCVWRARQPPSLWMQDKSGRHLSTSEIGKLITQWTSARSNERRHQHGDVDDIVFQAASRRRRGILTIIKPAFSLAWTSRLAQVRACQPDQRGNDQRQGDRQCRSKLIF